MIICLRHKVFLQSHKFGLQLFVWNTVGFCCIALSPSLKKVKVVDCGFIAVQLILAVTPSRIFYTVSDLERSVVIPRSASSSVIFENQIPDVKLMSTYIT